MFSHVQVIVAMSSPAPEGPKVVLGKVEMRASDQASERLELKSGITEEAPALVAALKAPNVDFEPVKVRMANTQRSARPHVEPRSDH